jgi:hypothetical protein
MSGSCSIDQNQIGIWQIDTKNFNQSNNGKSSIKDALFDNVEYAGTFTMYFNNKICKDKKNCSSLEKINRGNSSSVKTEDGFCNFHTHPMACYKGEFTSWGWPSGEDMRETIGFMMRGNLCHLVFTLEGIYVIQVNPNFLKVLLDDESLLTLFGGENFKHCKMNVDQIRGIIIGLVESYFKATHGHRGVDYIEKNKQVLEPKDWVQFANQFRFSNLINNTNKCHKDLPCNGFPSYEGHKKTMSLQKYIDEFGLDIYTMDKDGHVRDKKISDRTHDECCDNVVKCFEDIINLFNINGGSISYGGEIWQPGQWFRVDFYPNEFKIDDNTWVSYDEWLRLCKEKKKCGNRKSNGAAVIHKYWNTCQEMKDGIRFDEKNPPRISFRKVIGENCMFKNSKLMKEWLHNQQPKQKSNLFSSKRKKVIARKKGRKRINAFGQNKHKR